MKTGFPKKGAKRAFLNSVSTCLTIPAVSSIRVQFSSLLYSEYIDGSRRRNGRRTIILPLCPAKRVVRGSLHQERAGLFRPALNGKEVPEINRKTRS